VYSIPLLYLSPASNTSVKSVTFHDPPMLREEFLAMRASGQGISGFDGVGMAYSLMSCWFEKNTVESIKMPYCYCEDANYDNSGELRKMASLLSKFSSLKSFDVEFDDQVFYVIYLYMSYDIDLY